MEQTEKLHPNWRALATVPFDRKIFVKGKSDVFEAETNLFKAKKIKATQEEGREARAFYESVLNEPSTSKDRVPKDCPTKRKNSSKNYQHSIKTVNPIEKPHFQVRKSDLFKAVEEDNIEFVEKALEIQPSWKNLRDSYGWSLLMISCRAGSVQVTQQLIDFNADKSIQDKTGLDCYQLAKIDEIKSIVRPSPKFKIKTESEDPKSIVKDQKCDICQVDGLTEIEYKKHLTSMVHQFKLARQTPEVKVHYVIPEANPGYQMMLRSGWESNKGLGPPGKRGKLYPVKTTLKSDRHGLGLEEEEKLEKNEKKVTHFQAHDERGVTKIKIPGQRIERHTTMNKKYEKKKLDKQQQKEKNFRLEFSGL